MSRLTVHEMKTMNKYQNKYPEYQNQGKRNRFYDFIDNVCQVYFLLLGFNWLSNKVGPDFIKKSTK